MPKQKSLSAAKKRFKVTGSGRIKRESAFRSHILTKKSPKDYANCVMLKWLLMWMYHRLKECLECNLKLIIGSKSIFI